MSSQDRFIRDTGDAESGEFSDVELREQPYAQYGSMESAPLLPSNNSSTQRHDTWCNRICCCSRSSSVGNNLSNWFSCQSVLGVMNTLLIIFLSITAYYTYQGNDTRITGLENELSRLREDYDKNFNTLTLNVSKLALTEQSYEIETQSKIKNIHSYIDDINNNLDDQEHQLIRLSNGTSNADVLDKLVETKLEVAKHIEKEHSQVLLALQESNNTVTKRLLKSSEELKETKENVNKSLNETVTYMQDVVGIASLHIRSIQQNVSREMDAVTTKVQGVVRKLSEQVKSAEDTIHLEVDVVQRNIDQYVAFANKKFAAENDFVKYQLAGTFTLLSCLISLWHLTSHLRHFHKPDVQRRIMAVLWMVPIYSITSWMSLVWPRLEAVLGAIRDCYEAYAIYTFIALLIAVIEDGKGLQGMITKLAQRVISERDAVTEYEQLVAEQPPSRSYFFFSGQQQQEEDGTVRPRLPARPVEHIVPPWPCCYRTQRPTTVAAAWLYQCQFMAFQFVIMRPLLTVVPLVLRYTGVIDIAAIPMFLNGSINWHAPNIYILFVTNISVATAFYGLLSFYHGTEKDLEWCDPWPKFLCIKGVVFCTFWQSLTIQMLSTAGTVDPHSASQIQNLLICIEMLIASIVHFYVFPYEEWKEGYKKEREKGIMLRDTMALRDFVRDMGLMVTSWNTDENAEMELLSAEKAKLTSELHSLASRSQLGQLYSSSGSRRVSRCTEDQSEYGYYHHPHYSRSVHSSPGGGGRGLRSALSTAAEAAERGIGFTHHSDSALDSRSISAIENTTTTTTAAPDLDGKPPTECPHSQRTAGYGATGAERDSSLLPPQHHLPHTPSSQSFTERGMKRTDAEDDITATSPFPPSVHNPFAAPTEEERRPESAAWYVSETTDTSSAADVSRMEPEDGNQPFRRSHADSLTYSPYPSGNNILQSHQLSHQPQPHQYIADNLEPRRGLFSDLEQQNTEEDFLDVQSVSSAEESETSSGSNAQHSIPQHTMVEQSLGAAVDDQLKSMMSPLPVNTGKCQQNSAVPVPAHTPPSGAGNNASPLHYISDIYPPPARAQHSTTAPHPNSRDSLPGSSAFVDVLTPPPDHSPLPERGLGTWSAVRGTGEAGTGTQLEYDSDQSEYAI